MIHSRFIDHRPWVFTRRYYSPGGWRVPRLVWSRYPRWQINASGRSMSMHLSYLHGIPQAVRRTWRLLRSDVACAVCLSSERPWRRMMWYPFYDSSAGAFICSDACWERFDEMQPLDEEDE